MPRRQTIEDRYYDWLAGALEGMSKVVMVGLGNARLPRMLPDVQFDVVEMHAGVQTDLPNVKVTYGMWPNVVPTGGPWDALVLDTGYPAEALSLRGRAEWIEQNVSIVTGVLRSAIGFTTIHRLDEE